MHAKVWKCKFRYSGVCKMYEVLAEGGGDPYHGGGGGGGVATRDTEPYIHNIYDEDETTSFSSKEKAG